MDHCWCEHLLVSLSMSQIVAATPVSFGNESEEFIVLNTQGEISRVCGRHGDCKYFMRLPRIFGVDDVFVTFPPRTSIMWGATNQFGEQEFYHGRLVYADGLTRKCTPADEFYMPVSYRYAEFWRMQPLAACVEQYETEEEPMERHPCVLL